MKRALFVGSLVILAGLVSSTFACSSESSSATPSDCEAAFNKLCDKAASCTPTGKVTFISPSSGDAGGDAGSGSGSLSMKSAADCKILYGSSCSSQPPANVPACAAAAESAQCTTRASGEGALAFPAACQ